MRRRFFRCSCLKMPILMRLSMIPIAAGRIKHKLYALAGIALCILIIAAINFINISTAQAILPAKEVGNRKFMGSSIGVAEFEGHVEIDHATGEGSKGRPRILVLVVSRCRLRRRAANSSCFFVIKYYKLI